MNTHEQINEMLVDYVLGELSHQQLSEVETHLAECGQCSGEVKRLEALLESTEQMRGLSADEQMCESAKKALFETIVTEQQKEPTPRPKVGRAIMWRIIMKSKITKLAAAAVIVVTGSLIFFGDGQQTLYAKVMTALESARTIHVIAEYLDDEVWKKGLEAWYDKGLGVVEEHWRDGVLRFKRIDNGTYTWEYRHNSKLVNRSKSLDPVGVVARILDVREITTKALRDPENDRVVGNERYFAYVRSNEEKTYRILTWLDEVKCVRAWEKRHVLDGGQWETYRKGEVRYDVLTDPEVFTPEFGPNVQVVEVDAILDEYFNLATAVHASEVLGMVFAVHELKRCQGDIIYATCSIRPTIRTRKQVISSDVAAWNYATFDLGNSWRRLDRYGRGRSFEPIELAHIYHAGLQVQQMVFLPLGFEPEGPKECEFEVYVSTIGRLREKRLADGALAEQNFKPLAALALPQEKADLQQLMEDTYSLATELEPLVGFDRLTMKLQSVPYTNEEMNAWAQECSASPIAKRWLSGDEDARLEHALSNKPSDITKEDWIRDRMDYLEYLRNNYRKFLEEAAKRETNGGN